MLQAKTLLTKFLRLPWGTSIVMLAQKQPVAGRALLVYS
jgi:hypothetical protein